jgi:gamma-glutamylcyclotransferase
MKRRCPSSERVGIATLPKYRWGISCRGYANVYPNNDHIVYGILYSITPTDERSLDGYEGVSIGCYEKAELDVIMEDAEDGSEKSMRTLIYIDPRQEEGHPRQEYIDRMRVGLKDSQLPEEWVKKNIEPALSSGNTFENNQ